MRRDLKRWLLSALTGVLVSGLTGCNGETQEAGNNRPAVEFTLERLEGEPLTFPDDLEGRPVVIAFWADWCPVCEEELQIFEALYQHYRDQGLMVLALNVGQDRDTAAAFSDRLNVSYDVLLDRDTEVANRYGVMGLPTTFFIGRKGNVHAKIVGESSRELIEKVIVEIL
ncbi:MAG: TlpA disulfide reductase family protein [Candidatus Sedimenticola endophacoides]